MTDRFGFGKPSGNPTAAAVVAIPLQRHVGEAGATLECVAATRRLDVHVDAGGERSKCLGAPRADLNVANGLRAHARPGGRKVAEGCKRRSVEGGEAAPLTRAHEVVDADAAAVIRL